MSITFCNVIYSFLTDHYTVSSYLRIGLVTVVLFQFLKINKKRNLDDNLEIVLNRIVNFKEKDMSLNQYLN